LISEQVDDSVDFEVCFAFEEVAADVPLAVPCIVGEQESIPGETKQKGGRWGLEVVVVVVLSKRWAWCTPQGA
jgi:hypothetical protein